MDADLRPTLRGNETIVENLRAFEAIYAASVFEHLEVYRTIELLLMSKYCGHSDPKLNAREAQLYWYAHRTGYWASAEERRAAIRAVLAREGRPGDHGFDQELERTWYAFLAEVESWSRGATRYAPAVLHQQLQLTTCLSARAPRDLHLSASALRQEINQIECTLLRSAPRFGRGGDPWSTLDSTLQSPKESTGSRIQSARSGAVIVRWLAARISRQNPYDPSNRAIRVSTANGEPRTLAEGTPTTGELIVAAETWLRLNPTKSNWEERDKRRGSEPPPSRTRLGKVAPPDPTSQAPERRRLGRVKSKR